VLEKPEEAIHNGKSRYTNNIEHTRHVTKTNKTQKHNTENQRDEQIRIISVDPLAVCDNASCHNLCFVC